MGQVVLSLVVLLIIAGIFIWNAPQSALKQRLQPLLAPFVYSVGLDQSWEVFAPEFRKLELGLKAEIEYSDGTVGTWTYPAIGEPLLSPYRIYRWQKFEEVVRRDSMRRLWKPMAIWVARANSQAGRRPVNVTLIRRWRDLPAPGSETPPTAWKEYGYFSLPIPKEALR